ncbi:MAG: hypothetical protein LQ338_003250 [Usnochroma carphineum]|nr:MAG: hypothetical protein LQ338_003250 [Usnochroma carphineum]
MIDLRAPLYLIINASYDFYFLPAAGNILYIKTQGQIHETVTNRFSKAVNHEIDVHLKALDGKASKDTIDEIKSMREISDDKNASDVVLENYLTYTCLTPDAAWYCRFGDQYPSVVVESRWSEDKEHFEQKKKR